MSTFHQRIKGHEAAILSDWLKEMSGSTRRSDLMNDADLKQQASELLRLVTEASQTSTDVQVWAFSDKRLFEECR